MISIFEGLTATQTLALWGAVTGTIGTVTGVLGLWLRFRHQKRDQAQLKCEVQFNFEVTNGCPSPRYKFIVRSVGRRPVTLDAIEYKYNPESFKDRLLKHRLWRTGKWVSADAAEVRHRQTVSLSEGQKVELPIDKRHFDYLDRIARVYISDQSGKKWPVTWPSARELAILTQHGMLDRIQEETPRRTCNIQGYQLKSRFHLTARWNPDPPKKDSSIGKTFSFDKKSDYDQKLDDIRTVQLPKLLSEELLEFS